MKYAGYGCTDQSLAENIVQQAKAKHYTGREFIHALASSRVFQLK